MDVKDNEKTTAVSEESSESKAALAADDVDTKSAGGKSEATAQASEPEADAVKPKEHTKSKADNKVEVTAKTSSEALKPADSALPSEPSTTPKVDKVTTPVKEVTPVQAITTRSNEKESELTTLSGLLLVGLAAAMFYVGTVVFAKDSLIFFAGIFVYLLVAPPGTYAQGKSKMASFTKEVALAFAVTVVLFVILKTALPADQDQAQIFTVVLAILGIKLVHYPYYNTKKAEEEE